MVLAHGCYGCERVSASNEWGAERVSAESTATCLLCLKCSSLIAAAAGGGTIVGWVNCWGVTWKHTRLLFWPSGVPAARAILEQTAGSAEDFWRLQASLNPAEFAGVFVGQAVPDCGVLTLHRALYERMHRGGMCTWHTSGCCCMRLLCLASCVQGHSSAPCMHAYVACHAHVAACMHACVACRAHVAPCMHV